MSDNYSLYKDPEWGRKIRTLIVEEGVTTIGTKAFPNTGLNELIVLNKDCDLSALEIRDPAVLRGYTFGGKVRQWKTGDPAEDWTALYNAFASSYNLAVFRDDARMAEHLKGEYYKDRKFSYMLWEDGRPAACLIFQDIRHDPQAILEVQEGLVRVMQCRDA